MKQKDGGAIHPLDWKYHPGMTLRQWYAGQALAGAAQAVWEGRVPFSHTAGETPASNAAEWCLAQADALLAAEAKA